MRMSWGPRLLAAALLLAVGGCGISKADSASPPPVRSSAPMFGPLVAGPSTPPEPVPAPKARVNQADVAAAIRAVSPSATAAILVRDRLTGDEMVSVEADRPFRSASLVKLLIAVDVLRDGVPDERTAERIRQMLGPSNDGVASNYWGELGGTALLDRGCALMGLTSVAPPDIAGRWGNVMISARDVGTVFEYVLTKLPTDARDLVVNAMAASPATAADGFDQDFGITSALAAPRAVKQGWSDSAANIVVHSTGLVGTGWRYVVVVLTEHPRGMSWARASASVTAGTQALADAVARV